MNKKRILIVDDEQDVLLMLEKRFAAEGYSVITADNGERAIFLAKFQKPDLIVLDVQMPDMDGGEIAFKLKGDSATKDIPVVFSTCLFSVAESNHIRHESGGNVMLAKANDTKELIAVVDNILSSRELTAG